MRLKQLVPELQDLLIFERRVIITGNLICAGQAFDQGLAFADVTLEELLIVSL
jgi:hypothetical protein